MLTQPQLIASILNDLHLNKDNIITCKTPCLSTVLPHKDLKGQPMTNEFNYCSVIGKLNFLEKSTCPDIAYAVHQCTCFSADPRHSHADAVKCIRRYLKVHHMKELHYVLIPNKVSNAGSTPISQAIGSLRELNKTQ